MKKRNLIYIEDMQDRIDLMHRVLDNSNFCCLNSEPFSDKRDGVCISQENQLSSIVEYITHSVMALGEDEEPLIVLCDVVLREKEDIVTEKEELTSFKVNAEISEYIETGKILFIYITAFSTWEDYRRDNIGLRPFIRNPRETGRYLNCPYVGCYTEKQTKCKKVFDYCEKGECFVGLLETIVAEELYR